jgi:hypothetical protein
LLGLFSILSLIITKARAFFCTMTKYVALSQVKLISCTVLMIYNILHTFLHLLSTVQSFDMCPSSLHYLIKHEFIKNLALHITYEIYLEAFGISTTI